MNEDPVGAAEHQPEVEHGAYRSLAEVLDEIQGDKRKEVKVAFAIAGGGATGAYEAGVIDAYCRALSTRSQKVRHRLRPALIIGTSAGALNAVTMFLDQLKIGHPGITRMEGESFGAAVWRAIGAANKGARFVVGRRRWLVDLVTRYARGPIARKLATALPVFLLLLLNPILFVLVARGSERAWGRAAGAWVIAGVALAAISLAILAFWRAAFMNTALSRTLTNAVGPGAGAAVRARGVQLGKKTTAAAQREAGQRVVAAWEQARAEGDPPELIVTATDLTARRDALFTLVKPETFAKLAEQQWMVFQIGGSAPDLGVAGDARFLKVSGGIAGATDADQFIPCVVASTSIPGVFPSQRIPLHSFKEGGGTVVHDFVDGGVLNNAPIHIAIDAGATHVISLELNALHQKAPLEKGATDSEPSLPRNVIGTFMTMLDNATSEDIRKAADVNRDVNAGHRPGKSWVRVYRVAPPERKVELVEFDGHYESPFSRPSVNLVDWMEQGRASALNSHVFWDATLEEAPEPEVNPQDTCDRCDLRTPRAPGRI